MFDKLVESTKQKPQGRNKFYLVTSLIYGTALFTLAVATIIWFNPAMAEASESRMVFAPPPLPTSAPPPELSPAPKAAPAPGFVEPKEIPAKIPDPKSVTPLPKVSRGPVVAGVPNIAGESGANLPTSFSGGGDDNNAPPPPPPTPTPVPSPKATPTPAPTPETPKIVTVSTGVLHGKAVHRAQPPYPAMAKAIRAQGAVPVQITISEEGRVISAQAIGGHPTLQQAAQQAALQWVFTPTVLSGKPVKVSGVISFNFMLN